jgi:hypothetical protein
MRTKVFELNQNSGYTILIGVREENPTNRTRERIARAIAGAWSGLFESDENEWVPPYGFELVPDFSPLEGEHELPSFEPGKIYLVFVLLESTGSTVSEERERENNERILKAIRAGMGERYSNPRLGIITLYNCSVSILENPQVRPQNAYSSGTEFAQVNFRKIKRSN